MWAASSPDGMDTDYLTIDQAARLMRHQPSTVFALVIQGDLPASVRWGVDGPRIWRPAVEQYARKRAQGATDAED
jgi:excisionase family DNA binding protein